MNIFTDVGKKNSEKLAYFCLQRGKIVPFGLDIYPYLEKGIRFHAPRIRIQDVDYQLKVNFLLILVRPMSPDSQLKLQKPVHCSLPYHFQIQNNYMHFDDLTVIFNPT